MILLESEPRILEIRYGTGGRKGEMKIIVQSFLERQSVAKIRKLLNLIRTSYNPDAEQVLADFCRQWLTQYVIEQKILANKHVDAKEKAREIEINILSNQQERDRYRKNTEPYKQYTGLLKNQKNQLVIVNETARRSLTEFNRNQKTKAKYEKVLAIINQK